MKKDLSLSQRLRVLVGSIKFENPSGCYTLRHKSGKKICYQLVSSFPHFRLHPKLIKYFNSFEYAEILNEDGNLKLDFIEKFNSKRQFKRIKIKNFSGSLL